MVSFNDVVEELKNVYGHQELWLHSGLDEELPSETARRRREWRWAKILKRNGTVVAELTGTGDRWVLIGDYKKPQTVHSAPPWKACIIDDNFRTRCLLHG